MSRRGIIVALPREAKSLTKRRLPLHQVVWLKPNLSVVVAGMGAKQACLAAELAHRAGCTHLLSWGVAAAVDPQLRAGDLVVPSIVFNEQDDWVVCNEELIRTLGQQTSAFVLPLLSTATVIATPADKATFFATKAISVIDRESFFIGSYAREHGLLFSAVRSVVDACDCVLPPAALCAYNDQGNFQSLRFVWSLLRQPNQWRALYHLAAAMQLAITTLTNIQLPS